MLPSIKKIIETLISKTASGEFIWTTTSKPGEYKFQFESGPAITVFDEVPETNPLVASLRILAILRYNFKLFNAEGNVVTTLSGWESEEDKALVERLFRVVDGNFKKEDQTLDDISKELGI